MRKFLIGAATAVVMTIAAVAVPSAISAFSESQYTGNGKPQFNVYTDVPNVGDERDFVRVGAKNAPAAGLTNNYEACDGEATVSVYVHNGAPEIYNGTNNDGTGVAHDTRVKVTVPATSAGSFNGTISAKDRDGVAVPSVMDGAKITCNGEAVELEYVPGSAEMFTLDRGNVVLGAQGDAIVTAGGLQIGSLAGDGIVPGCWNFRNYVKMVVKIKKVVKTPVYTCDLFQAITSADNKNKYTFKAKASATNAVIKSYDFDFGNGQKQTVTTSAGEATSQEVTYTKDATAKLTVHFTVNGEDKTATSDTKCVVQIKFNQPPVNPPTTPKVPTTIVETGAGSTIGLFASVTALAYGFKRYMDSRANARG